MNTGNFILLQELVEHLNEAVNPASAAADRLLTVSRSAEMQSAKLPSEQNLKIASSQFRHITFRLMRVVYKLEALNEVIYSKNRRGAIDDFRTRNF